MDTATHDRPDPAELQFADSFLQERNIKWILASGAAILLGSSLMLVTSQWEGYSAVFKAAIFLAYTYGVFAAGKYGYGKLALRRTGSMLSALSLLLAPAACAALPWLWEQESWNVAYVALLIAAGGVATRIGASTFRHFLHESQPTLTAAYVLLSLAGAVVPLSDLALSPPAALALWGVFAVGALKANRRIFWLVEEHRRPRIVGFFPLALLGAQYLALFGLFYARRTELDWIGFGCVLTAIPLLAAADSVARVFQQRTGDLVRPLPWSILAPLGGGLLLSAVGVVLAATKLSYGLPWALVPTAAVAALLMVPVARRTGRREFVYAAIALTVVAYRFLPVYFVEAVRSLVHATAAAIDEPKLPWAYYGFTFLPLLALFTFAAEACRRRGDLLFAEPLRIAAIALSGALLALSVTHEKALFPAAATLAVVFAAQTVVFRNRLPAAPALLAICLAAAGLPAFHNGVFAVRYGATVTGSLSPSVGFTCEAVLALLLTTFGLAVDRFLQRYPLTYFGRSPSPAVQRAMGSPCRQAGLLLTAVLGGLWLVGYAGGFADMPGLSVAWLLAVTGLLQGYVQRSVNVAAVAVLFANIVAGIAMSEVLPRDREHVLAQTVVLVSQWLGSYVLLLRPESRLGATFGPPLRKTSLVMLALPYGLVVLPLHALHAAIPGFFSSNDFAEIAIPSVLFVAWACDAARRERNAYLGYAALVGLFLFASSLFRNIAPDAWEWLPLLWTMVAAALVPLELLMRRDEIGPSGLRDPLRQVVPGMLLLVSLGSWCCFTLPMSAAGFAAPVVLATWLAVRRHPLQVQLPCVLLNWRVLGLAAMLACPHLVYLGDLNAADVAKISLPVALTAAISLVVWTALAPRLRKRLGPQCDLDLVRPQQCGLRLVAGYLMTASLSLPELSVASLATAVAVFAVFIASELSAACRDRDERRVWTAEALAALAVGYLAWFHVIHFGRGFAMYLVLGLGLAMWLVGRLAERRATTAVLAGPFQDTGRLLPLVTVGLGLYRHAYYFELHGVGARWLGWNSLALLLAAAFYFHQGLMTRVKGYTVLAAGILNTAVMLLWRELHLSDPQFYLIPVGITVLGLVELLEREIPAAYRDPLRYAGALLILVSPMFHIVDGSWLHIFTLMVAAALVLLAGIGLRVRAMLYVGTAFLLADLAAMVVRGSIDHPELLWVAGLMLGASVLGLGAVCEMRRERILQRVRAVSSALDSWK